MNVENLVLLTGELGENISTDTLLDFFITIFDASPNISFIKDEQGKYLFVNKAFEDYSQLPKSDIIGKTDFDFMPEAEAKECVLSDQPARNQPNKVHTSFEIKHDAKGAISSYLSVNKHVVETSIGQVLIGVVTEVQA